MTTGRTWAILFLWVTGVATGVVFLAEWQYGDVWTLLTMRSSKNASSLSSKREQSKAVGEDVALQYARAVDLSRGIGGDADPEAAVSLFAVCAKRGFAPGQYMLGVAYWSGEGIRRDKRLGLEWIRRAADGGNMQAQLFMGIVCFEGEETPRNVDAAIVWFEKAAENGSADALFNLGELYRNGVGVPADSQAAARYYHAAAAGGLAKAESRLASLGSE